MLENKSHDVHEHIPSGRNSLLVTKDAFVDSICGGE